MYLVLLISCSISFLILKKNVSAQFNIFYFFFSFILILIGYEFYQINFTDDSRVYYDVSKHIFLNYNFYEIFKLDRLDLGALEEDFFTRHNGIFYLNYIIFSIFGLHELSLASFFIISKSFACVYLYNFSSRQINNFTKYKYSYFLLFLYEPWTIYFNNFLFLKEGFVFLFIILILVNFYKILIKFKFKYLLIIILSLTILFSIRFYYLYLLTIFFLFYIFVIQKNILLRKKNLFIMFLLFIIFIFLNFLFDNLIYRYIHEYILSINSIIKESKFNILGPIKFLFSPLFYNVLIAEFNIYRIVPALIYNLISILFVFFIIFYDYKNNFINFIFTYLIIITFAQILSPDEILTGGRHRSSIVWTFPIFIVYFFTKYKIKFK